MAEYLRSIEVQVVVDTNKRTMRETVSLDSLSDEAIEDSLTRLRRALAGMRL